MLILYKYLYIDDLHNLYYLIIQFKCFILKYTYISYKIFNYTYVIAMFLNNK